MATVKDVLKIADSQVGITEIPPNSNCVKYNTAFYGHSVKDGVPTKNDKYPWCAAFIWWVFTQAGIKIKKTASCMELGQWFKDNGKWVEAGNQREGDVVFYKFKTNNRWTNHVGLVGEVIGAYDIYDFEGNTSTGNDCNGGAVMYRHRNSNIVGFGRPDYDPEPIIPPSDNRKCVNGIDIARYQKGIDLSKVPCDFVIVKATQDTQYVNPEFNKQIVQADSLGKLIGVYHYSGGGGAIPEANHFLDVVKDYIGRAILCLDWEGRDNPNFGNPEYAKAFLSYVKQQTGVTPFIYMSKSVARQYSSSWDSSYPFWCAQYPKNQKPTGYKEDPWTDTKGFGAWKGCAILQYSSKGQLKGYYGDLDLDKSYISADDWMKYARGEHVSEEKPEGKTDTLPILKKGDKNEYVRNWQLLLNLNGYHCGTADGIFGPKTDAAVRKWQKDHGLEVDGAIGPKTWASLPMVQ